MAMDPERSLGWRLLIIAWLCFFALLYAFFYFYKSAKPAARVQIENGVVIIQPDASGQYRLSGAINGQVVEFMVDTGATMVAIPQNVAQRLGLKNQYPITVKTANGSVTGYLTRLETVHFAQFTLNQVKAVIIPADNHQLVLLGMNVLSHFTITQQNHQLHIKK